MIIKRCALFTVLSVTAFCVYSQDDVDAAKSNDSGTMVVTANRFPQPVSTVLAPMDVVTREDIVRWQAKSLNDVLRRLPGIDISQYGGRGQLGSLYVRGANASHALVLIDGVRMASPGVTGSIDFSQIPMSLVQRIEYIRGPRSAVYGSEAISGVINIITQRTDEGGELNIGAGSHRYQLYDGSLRQRLGASTVVTLAGSYEDTRGFNIIENSPVPADADDDGFRSKSYWAGLEQNFSSRLSGFFRGYGYTNNTEYDFSYAATNESQLYSNNYDMGLRFKEDNFASQLIGSYQKYKNYNYDSSQGPYSRYATLDDVSQRSLQWGNTYQLSHGMLSAGIDWREEQIQAGTASIPESKTRKNTGVYLTSQQQIKSVTLEGSLRNDDNQQFGSHATWQTAIGWEFIDGYRTTVSYGTGFKAPTMGQLYASSEYILGNPELEPEESKQWELGINGLSGPFDWKLSVYRNEINNLIDGELDGSSRYNYINVGHALIKGTELQTAFDTGFITHKVILEYLDPENRDTGKKLNGRSKHKAKYQLDAEVVSIDWSLAYQYYGERPDGSRDLPAYSLWDLAASYPITSHLTVRGRIANLFDKDYETVYGYRTPGREYYFTGSYTF